MRNLITIIAVAAVVTLFAVVGTKTAAAMNKAELIDAIAKDSGLSKADSKRALESLTGATATTLKKGNSVQLVGFGTFSVSKQAARSLSQQDDLTRHERGCLWLAVLAPEWLHGLFCTVGDDEIIELMTAPDASGVPALTEKEARVFLGSFNAVTTDQLVIRDTVDIDDFGSFTVQEGRGRRLNTVEFTADQPLIEQFGRNPQTGKEIKIAAKNVVKFKAGAALSKKVN